MTEQLALMWCPTAQPGRASGTVEAPEWLGTGETREQRRHALAGKHPTGRPLGPDAETCRSCAHAVPFGSYRKCRLDEHRWSKCRASDIRCRWRACSLWSPAT